MEAVKVGIRQFREDMAEYIASNKPIAITRHGQTVGFFIPAHGQDEERIAALKKAGKTLDKMLADQQVDVEEIVAEFKATRRSAAGKNKASVKAA